MIKKTLYGLFGKEIVIVSIMIASWKEAFRGYHNIYGTLFSKTENNTTLNIVFHIYIYIFDFPEAISKEGHCAEDFPRDMKIFFKIKIKRIFKASNNCKSWKLEV